MEAGEKDELLDKGDGAKGEGEAKGEGAAEGAAAGEGGEGGEAPKAWEQHLCRAKQCGTQALDRFNGLEKTQRMAATGLCGALVFILLIIVIVCAAVPSGYSNDFRIVDCTAGTTNMNLQSDDQWTLIGLLSKLISTVVAVATKSPPTSTKKACANY